MELTKKVNGLLSRISKKLPEKFRPDFNDEKDVQGHQKHFYCASAFALIFPFVIFGLSGLSLFSSVITMFALAQVAIFVKEIYDMKKKNKTGFSWQDIIAGEMAIVPVTVLLLIVAVIV